MEPDRMASDALGTPGEPVAEVDTHDLKTFWVETRNFRAKYPDQSMRITFQAVWYRSTTIEVLTRFAQERMSAWLVNGDVSDAVFRTKRRFRWNGSGTRTGKVPLSM